VARSFSGLRYSVPWPWPFTSSQSRIPEVELGCWIGTFPKCWVPCALPSSHTGLSLTTQSSCSWALSCSSVRNSSSPWLVAFCRVGSRSPSLHAHRLHQGPIPVFCSDATHTPGRRGVLAGQGGLQLAELDGQAVSGRLVRVELVLAQGEDRQLV